MNNSIYVTEDQKKRILEDIVDNYKKNPDLHEVSHPKLIFIAGQPGAGKSRITELQKKYLRNNSIIIDIDKFRQEYPNFDRLTEIYPNNWTQYTQEFASNMGKRVIEKFSKEKYNVIIDGTLKNYDKTKNIIDMYKIAGFTIEVDAVATKPDISRIGIVSRYSRMIENNIPARNVPLEVHENTIKALPSNLDKLQENNLVDAMYVFDRFTKCYYDSNVTPSKKASVELIKFQNTPLNELEKLEIDYKSLEIFKNLELEKTDIALNYLDLTQKIVRQMEYAHNQELVNDEIKLNKTAQEIGDAYVEAIEEVYGTDYVMEKGGIKPSSEFLDYIGGRYGNKQQSIHQYTEQEKKINIDKEMEK